MATQSMKKTPDLSAVKLLGSMCFNQDKTLAEQADNALYQQIIIPLCDDFTSRSTRLSLLILATLIQQAAKTRDKESRHALNRENLHNTEQLLDRLNRIQKNKVISTSYQQQIRKICILSRVTIGADICITSVIIQRLHQQFPETPITVIGPNHLPQLFNYPFLHHSSFTFNKKHSNGSRISHWLQLQQIISHERQQLTGQEFLLIDPDTRLSQLGLLPLAPEYSTRILPSRIDQSGSYSLSKITNIWLDSILQTSGHCYPALSLKTPTTPAENTKFTIIVNFGVGQDQRKRISLQFEKELILYLIQLKDSRIILDSGKGENEINQAEAIEDFIREQPVSAPSFHRIQDSIDVLAQHIRMAHLFIGYDSCSGHIATACQTPAVICFKGAPNSRFYARWLPENQAKTAYCLKVTQKQLTNAERSLLIHRIIDIASSHYQTFQSA
jgi:ADP-heptose:LPS heptosyltransferase